MVANRFQHRGLAFPVKLDKHGQRKPGESPPKLPQPAPRSSLAPQTEPPVPGLHVASPPALRTRSPAAIRRSIADSSVADMLIDYVEGRIEMEPLKVTVALNLLRKILPDLANVAPPADLEEDAAADDLSLSLIEFRIVEPEAK